jgi:hypothetical protein
VVGGERAPGDAGEGRQVSGPGRHGAHVGVRRGEGFVCLAGRGVGVIYMCWSFGLVGWAPLAIWPLD